MNSVRLGVGVLFILFGSNICRIAMAQAVEHPAQAIARQDVAPTHRVLLTAVPEDHAYLVDPDEFGPPGSSAPSSPDAPMLPAFDQSLSMTPPISSWQEDGLDESCCLPCKSACPSAYVQTDALFMWREPRFNRQAIIVDANTNTTFLSTSDLDFDVDPGLRATVGMPLCGGRTVEFSYFGLFEADDSAFVASPGPAAFLIFPGNLAGNVFVDIDRARVDYSSELHSLEVNLPCCCGCCQQYGGCCASDCGGCGGGCGEVHCHSYSWFADFRYFNLSEELRISAQRDILGGVEEGAYDIRTDNHLYGAQLGGRWRYTRSRLGWEASAKAGVFGYDAQQEQSVTDFPNFPLRPLVSSSDTGVAFVGELNVSALYSLTHAWSLRAGYTALGIDEVALAPDQLDFDFATAPSGDQLHLGSLVLHGATVGLEARW